MNTYQAYQFELERLTEEQKLSLNAKENNIGRKLLPCEIVQIFKLEPYTEIRQPRKRRLSDEVEENNNWMNQ
jgi:hypothetical protein